MRQICKEEKLVKAWLKEDSENPYRSRAIREHQKQVAQFPKSMLMVLYMVRGQPARTREISGMCYCNSSTGGFRDILIYRGLMCFIAAYHKNYGSFEQIKIIFQYLPRVVGELLVCCLWLVLLFRQISHNYSKA